MAFDFENNTNSQITVMDESQYCQLFVSSTIAALQPGVKHETHYDPVKRELLLESFWPLITHHTRQSLLTAVFKQPLLLRNIKAIRDYSLNMPAMGRTNGYYSNQRVYDPKNGMVTDEKGYTVQWDVSGNFDRFFDLYNIIVLSDQYRINRPDFKVIVHHIEDKTKTKAYEYVNHFYYLFKKYPNIIGNRLTYNAFPVDDIMKNIGDHLMEVFKKEWEAYQITKISLTTDISVFQHIITTLHDKALANNKAMLRMDELEKRFKFIVDETSQNAV